MKLKVFTLMVVAFCAVRSFAEVSIIDKKGAELRLTKGEAQYMTQIILERPVLVTQDHFELVVQTYGRDFNHNEKYLTTGKVTCKKDGSECIVKGSELREAGDGTWFVPSPGYVRLFGMGTVAELDKRSYFKCDQVYANIACDFKL
ncbi:MAG: hypothetical protein IPJ71_00010 [Bdellovibrionales bacterium]|nr:hypothetical protein [Bdellovibrionales bacterium]